MQGSNMFIYNVTIKIADSIHEPWLKWMLDEHLVSVMDTGCFERFQFVKLLEVDEEEGPTYAVQYYAISKAHYNRYIDIYSSDLRKATTDKWGEKLIAFRTLMEVVR
jgi:hypothetical protein